VANPAQISITSPVLADKAFSELGTALTSGVSWLTNMYGRAYTHLIETDQGTIRFPAVPVQSGIRKDYLKLFPDQHLGEFGFFTMTDYATIDFERHATARIDLEWSLIIWGDLRNIYPSDWNTRTVEHMKYDVISTMIGVKLEHSKGLNIKGITDTGSEIYREWDADEIENQFLMRPFAGFRIEGSFRVEQQCT